MSGPKGFGGDDLPDPQEMLQKLRQNLRYVIYGAVGVALVLGLLNSYYTVEADEQGVVLRLGRPTGEIVQPGLHFRIPVIDQVFKAQTKKIRQLEFGFRTRQAGVRSDVDEGAREQGLMLTGDLELVSIQWTVLYRIADLEQYLFMVRDVEETIRDISEANVRLLVGDRSSDEVMTIQREEIAERARELIQDSLDACQSGIKIESVALRQVEPPDEAQEAFNKVNEARARKQQAIEKAKREKEARVSPMRGRKEAIISMAQGVRDRQILEALGEARRFEQTLAAYEKDPETTRRWLYLETMLRIWKKVGRKFIIGDTGSTMNLLPLGELGLTGTKAAERPSIISPGVPSAGRSSDRMRAADHERPTGGAQ